MKEIKIITGECEKVKLGDDIIQIKQFGLETLPMVVQYLEVVYKKVDQDKIKKALSSKGKNSEQVIVLELLKAIGLSLSTELNTILRIIGACTDIEMSKLSKLPIDAVMALIKEIVLVNKDFFSQRLLPTITEMFKEVGEAKSKKN